MSQPLEPQTPETDAQIQRSTRRAFISLGVAGLAGFGGWRWLRTRLPADGIPWPLRQAQGVNEAVGRQLFSPTHLAPEFPAEAAMEPRSNGWYGAPPETAPPAKIEIVVSGQSSRSMTVAEILADLPRVTSTTELKCIEGWSTVVSWSGVRLADVIALHKWPPDLAYVSMMTADGVYFVGLDMPSALHSQTMLCDRINGEALPHSHGGPLRLVIPVKYGIKNIKWIAKMEFTNTRPADYWAMRGYDWYAGL